MLTRLPIGATATVTRIQGGRNTERKLMSLGIKKGSEIEILHRRGKGVVVRSSGTRIAIGEGVAEKVLVAPGEAHYPNP